MLLHFLAQATNAATGTPDPNAAAAPAGGGLSIILYFIAFAGLVYFLMLRPQSEAKKKQEAMLKAAKTGDRVITTGGIHGVITNVKDTTVIVKVADNVKLELEKNHIDKITSSDPDPEKVPATK